MRTRWPRPRRISRPRPAPCPAPRRDRTAGRGTPGDRRPDHRALRGGGSAAEERLQIVEESMTSGIPGAGIAHAMGGGVRDWFHIAGNCAHPLDRGGRDAGRAARPGGIGADCAGSPITVSRSSTTPDEAAPLRLAQPPARRSSTPNGAACCRRAAASRSRISSSRSNCADTIQETVEGASVASTEACYLLRIGLANYAAGALTMPYARSRRHRAADAPRHRPAVPPFRRQLRTGLSPALDPAAAGAEGILFISVGSTWPATSPSGIRRREPQFARFGGACPLWIVHEAVAIPDPDRGAACRDARRGALCRDGPGGLVKPSGSFTRSPRRYAVTLGCEAEHAADFVYADALDRTAPPIPIGISCRSLPAGRLRPARLSARGPGHRGRPRPARHGAVPGGLTSTRNRPQIEILPHTRLAEPSRFR